jgi:hypothetical protein
VPQRLIWVRHLLSIYSKYKQKKQIYNKMDHDEQERTRVDQGNGMGRAALLPIDVIIYVSQLMVACSVLGFSGFMLHQGGGDCEKSSPYLGQ